MSTVELSVPRCAADLTASWLAAALAQRGLDIALDVVTVTRIAADLGLASEVYRCELQHELLPASLIAKLWDTSQAAGEREVHFYREFANYVPIRVPACLYAAADSATSRGVLLLEDYPEVEQGDCLQYFTRDDAQRFAELLALLHADWQDSPRLAAAWLRRLSWLERDNAWHSARRARFLERFGAQLDPLVLSFIERSELLQATANTLLTSAPVTLIHADLHLDNVLFKAPDREAILLDWARCASGPAALDVVELAYGMTPEADQQFVLTAYVDTLRSRMTNSPDESALRTQLNGAALRACVFGTLGIANWEPDTVRGQAILASHLERRTALIRQLASANLC